MLTDKDKNATLKAQLSESRMQTREYKKRLQKARAERHESMRMLKDAENRNAKLSEELNNLKKNRTDQLNQRLCDSVVDAEEAYKIKRHTYGTLVIKLCMLYYLHAGCSLRSVEKIMKITGEVLLGALGIDCCKEFYPVFNTISLWLEKCGLSKVGKTDGKTISEWSYIIDESISANAEKLLLVLGVPADCAGEPLKMSEARVLRMSVSQSRDASKIAKEIELTKEATGINPQYIIGDGGRNLVKGTELAGCVYHLDCGHTIANILKSEYAKDEEFQELNEAVGRTKRCALTGYAYLMPPAMRSIARFMNLSQWIYWARKMNENATIKMSSNEKWMYGFLQKHAGLVEELYQVMEEINKVLKIIKNDGLSTDTFNRCKALVYKRSNHEGEKGRKVGMGIIKYLKSELSKMNDKDKPCHISSDIIESYFGYDKSRMSKNKRTGFTSRVLTLAIRPFACDTSTLSLKDIKEMLEGTSVSDVEQWRKVNLSPSQMKKRKEKLTA